jgi:hypothetical protein
VAGSNYDVNIKLDVRKINQQINNLERRISKLNALAQGKRGDSKILLKNERDKAALILKQERAQKRVNRELQKTNKLKKENLLLTNKTTAKTTADKSRASSGSTVVSTGGGKSGVLSGALISGAFPLLFGQGPLGGALGFAGGAIGGAIGGQTGGFAGGLIATAGLTQIQQAIQGINELGAALKPESLNLDKLITSLGLIGTEESKRLKLIEQLEGKQAALNEVTKEMNRVVGEDGVRKIKEFTEVTRTMGNNFARVMTQMMSGLTSAIMDSPLGEFLTKRSQKGKINAALPGDIETTDPVLKRLIAEQQKLLAPKNEAELNKAVNQQALGPLSLSSGGLFPQQIQNTAEQQLADESSAKSLNMQLQSIERSIEARKQVLFTSKEQELKDTNAKKTSELILRDVKAQNQFLQESITLGTFQAEIEQKIRDLKQQQKAIGKDLSADDEKAFRDQLRLQRELERVNSLYQGIADTVQSGLVDAIEGAINGTKTLGDVARSVFGAIQRQLINFAATSFLRAIPGIGGFFANGGVTKPNKSYIVGERGPELFTPGVTGRVTPNHEMGGGSTNVVVNVDASGSNVEGDEDEGRALGVALSAAIEAELLKQKRPGGLLA